MTRAGPRKTPDFRRDFCRTCLCWLRDGLVIGYMRLERGAYEGPRAHDEVQPLDLDPTAWRKSTQTTRCSQGCALALARECCYLNISQFRELRLLPIRSTECLLPLLNSGLLSDLERQQLKVAIRIPNRR